MHAGSSKDLNLCFHSSTPIDPGQNRPPPIPFHTDASSLSTNPAWVTRIYSRNNQLHKVQNKGCENGHRCEKTQDWHVQQENEPFTEKKKTLFLGSNPSISKGNHPPVGFMVYWLSYGRPFYHSLRIYVHISAVFVAEKGWIIPVMNLFLLKVKSTLMKSVKLA